MTCDCAFGDVYRIPAGLIRPACLSRKYLSKLKYIILFFSAKSHLNLILHLARKCTKIITEQNVVLQSTYLHGQNECVVFYLSVFLTGALLKTQKIFWGASRCALRRLARLRELHLPQKSAYIPWIKSHKPRISLASAFPTFPDSRFSRKSG